MTARGSRWVIWLALLCVVPLPFFLVETGAVPALRLLLVGGVFVALIVVEGSSGVVDILAALVLGQALLYGIALFGVAHGLASAIARLGPRRVAPCTLALVAGALLVATAFDLYRTPFRTTALRGNLLEILE